VTEALALVTRWGCARAITKILDVTGRKRTPSALR
jgi:hypothetical protein